MYTNTFTKPFLLQKKHFSHLVKSTANFAASPTPVRCCSFLHHLSFMVLCRLAPFCRSWFLFKVSTDLYLFCFVYLVCFATSLRCARQSAPWSFFLSFRLWLILAHPQKISVYQPHVLFLIGIGVYLFFCPLAYPFFTFFNSFLFLLSFSTLVFYLYLLIKNPPHFDKHLLSLFDLSNFSPSLSCLD